MGACWAHNPEVDGSKPSSAIVFSQALVLWYWQLCLVLSRLIGVTVSWFQIILDVINEQSGAVGACWAHNPEVDGSKPSSAIVFSQVLVLRYWQLCLVLSRLIGVTVSWFQIILDVINEQSGAVGACWAHNPEVDGSKPSSANLF